MDGRARAGNGGAEWCRALVDASPDGILATDASGLVVFVSPGLRAMSGYGEDDLVGRPVELLVPELDRARHAGLRRPPPDEPRIRAMGEGQDLRLRRQDGSLLPVEVDLTPVLFEGRRMTMATVRDVSRRQSAERDQARLYQILDLVPDAILVTDATTLLVEYANPAVSSLTGDPVGELVGTPIGPTLSGAAGTHPHSAIEDLAHGQEPVPYVDYVLHGRSGVQVPIELHQRLVTDADGSRHVVAVGRDLRPRFEQERLLRTSEQAFRTAFEQAPIAVEVIALTPDGTRSIVMANQAMADMFACTVADLIGRNLDEFTFPEDRERDRALAADLAAGRRAQVSRLNRYRVQDGRTVWAEYRATSFELSELPGPLALVHLVDVTDRAAEQARREREALLRACAAETARAALAAEPEADVLARIAQGARDILEARGALLLVADDGPGSFRVDAATGDLAVGLLHTDVDLSGVDMWAQLAEAGSVALPGPPPGTPEPWVSSVGPLAAARFGSDPSTLSGLLAVVREPGASRFTRTDAELLGRLSEQTQLAIQLAVARADQQRLALLEERQRIARDLHDSVLQDLIALGMQISSTAERATDPASRDREVGRVEQLEAAVRQLRRVVFDLAPSSRQPLGLAMRRLGREASRVLRHHPRIDLSGPVDALPADVAADVLSVTREALSNVARHAGASITAVTLSVAEGRVTLTVDDDGCGVDPAVPRGYGLASIELRAAERHGSATLGQRDGGGTRLTWSCPLRDEQAPDGAPSAD